MALLIIGARALQAALNNPAKSLKNRMINWSQEYLIPNHQDLPLQADSSKLKIM
ncbi:MAG: hypothetical protein IPO25_18675 [Saprospiraceae bacterium]|nr:hypothetical protein [Saprospiraceae bacterium]